MSWGEPWSKRHAVGVVEDAIAVVDVGGRSVTKSCTEAFRVQDAMSRRVVKGVLRNLGIDESYVDNVAFTLRAFESLWVDELVGKKIELPFAEGLGVAETEASRRISLGINEAAAVSEVFGRTVAYRLALAEGLGAADALSKVARLGVNEALDLYDEYLRKSNAVISDMITDAGDITESDLLAMVENGHAPGFGQFKSFIPGDYDVQRALFRVVLQSNTSDRARLNQMSVQADVPDVFDRGTVEISAAQAATGVRVEFSRVFHIVPEITLTLRGGTVVALPDVVSSDEKGFVVVLKNPVTGERVAGRVTWAAHGY